METATFEQESPIISSPICQCACGTRISLDEQLLNEREEWKNKYYCLQKQTSKEIGLLKEKIYQECSTLMHNEFLSKEKSHAQIVNAKNLEIQELTSKIIKLETAFKISEKEKEVLTRRLEEEEKRFAEQLEELSDVKTQHIKKLNYLQEQNLSETGALKIRITEDYETKVDKLEKENEHLRHKITEFEKKYASIIPEVEKLKNIIAKKTAEIESLEQQREKLKETNSKEVNSLKSKIEELERLHLPCIPEITELTHKIANLENQLAKAKLVKKEVKVEPVYVDRPVEVERVVEKLIEVEKIVKEYIEPTEDYRLLEEDNRRLKQELENIIHELKIFETRYEQTLQQNEDTVHQYEENIKRYKTERESLVKRIHEQDEELEKIFQLINSNQQSYERECRSGENEKIVVHVNKDGTVNKRIEKINIDEKVKATVSKIQERYQDHGEKKTEQNLKNPTSVVNQRVTRSTTAQQIRKK